MSEESEPSPPSESTGKLPEDLTYRQAAEDIERTLREIEGEQNVDIDELADRVERASDLIQFCFERLKRAELRVRKVTDKLARSSDEEEPG